MLWSTTAARWRRRIISCLASLPICFDFRIAFKTPNNISSWSMIIASNTRTRTYFRIFHRVGERRFAIKKQVAPTTYLLSSCDPQNEEIGRYHAKDVTRFHAKSETSQTQPPRGSWVVRSGSTSRIVGKGHSSKGEYHPHIGFRRRP